MRKVRIFCLILVASVAGFVCMLSGLDAPEYVRCEHIGVCEFLDICGDLSVAQKSKIQMESIGFPYQNFTSRAAFEQWSSFVPSLKKVACFTGYIQDFTLLNKLLIVDRCVQPSHEILSPPLMQDGEILGDAGHTSSSAGSRSPSPGLQIIPTVIIRC
jgi:hypothetical protein